MGGCEFSDTRHVGPKITGPGGPTVASYPKRLPHVCETKRRLIANYDVRRTNSLHAIWEGYLNKKLGEGPGRLLVRRWLVAVGLLVWRLEWAGGWAVGA